jgi:hypothetical protein
MRELLVSLLKEPTKETYLALREAIVASGRYEPYSNELSSINSLIEHERFEAALRSMQEAMPNLLLSPQAHLMNAFVLSKLENKDSAEMERRLAWCCLEGMMATGDGSEEHPYAVLRVEDERDLLRYLRKELVKQELISRAKQRLDRVECTDGSVVWFDVSTALDALDAQMAGKGR